MSRRKPRARAPGGLPTAPNSPQHRVAPRAGGSLGSQSVVSPGSFPLRGGPLELGLMSVAKLQVSLVRLVRFTMLESLPLSLRLRLFVDS